MRILLVDDHILFRQGLYSLLGDYNVAYRCDARFLVLVKE